MNTASRRRFSALTGARLPGLVRSVVVFCLLLAAGLPGRAVEVSSGPTVEPAATRAVIHWTTARSAGGRVQFGPTARSMTNRVNAGVVDTAHDVILTGLQPGTTYWYSVGTARGPLATNSFTTLGGAGGNALLPAPVAPTQPAGAERPPVTAATAFDPTRLKVPPTRETWGSPRSLQDHFDRHGADFHARDPDDYAAQAWIFLRRARAEKLPAKRDADGVLRVYDPKTRAFAAYNPDLTTKTYFKPGRRDYFADQPGTPVDLATVVK